MKGQVSLRKAAVVATAVVLSLTIVAPASANHSKRSDIPYNIAIRQGNPGALTGAGWSPNNASDGAIGAGTDHPNATATILQFRWADYEPTDDAWNPTIEGNLDEAFDDACSEGYHIGIRMRAGADAPVGRPGATAAQFPDWLKTQKGVITLDTRANEASFDSPYISGSPDPATQADITLPVAFPTKAGYSTSFGAYQAEYQEALTRLKTVVLDSLCPGSGTLRHRRFAFFLAVSLPTELGTEMTLGYGGFAGSGDCATPGNAVTFNRCRWDSISTESERRAQYTLAWQRAIQAHFNVFGTYAFLRHGVAGGHLFLDDWAGADSLFANNAIGDDDRVIGMVTNLDSDYADEQPAACDFMRNHVRPSDAIPAAQLAGESILPSGSAVVGAIERSWIVDPDGACSLNSRGWAMFNSANPAQFIEIQGERDVTSPTYDLSNAIDGGTGDDLCGGWPGVGTRSMRDYFFLQNPARPANVQDRLEIQTTC